MAYSLKKWAEVRTEYESTGCSIPELRDKYGISTSSIEKHIAKEGWVKNCLKPIIEETVRKTMLQRYADLGLTPDDMAKKVIKMINAKDPHVVDKGLNHYEKHTGINAPEKHKVENTHKMSGEEARRILKEHGFKTNASD